MRASHGLAVLAACLFLPLSASAEAATLREQLQEKVAGLLAPPSDDPIGLQTLVPGSQRRSERYGDLPRQDLDVYLPPHARDAPILVMVHGGGWKEGDKAEPHVVVNKIKHWLPQGFILVSVNYRLVPDAMAYEQAEDVAKALKWVQQNARSWGGRADKIILMGHSAGAHLVALLSSKPEMVGKPWAATIALDTSALHIPSKMRKAHLPFYDAAFGKNTSYWTKASPMNQWSAKAVPLMLTCSMQRPDKPCHEAQEFKELAARSGREIMVSPQPLNHAEMNDTLGLPGAYTSTVETFITRHLAGK